jgi:hypothetical protein
LAGCASHALSGLHGQDVGLLSIMGNILAKKEVKPYFTNVKNVDTWVFQLIFNFAKFACIWEGVVN